MLVADKERAVKRIRTGYVSVSLLVCALLPYAAHAQEAADTGSSSSTAQGVEITPFVAIGSVRASTVGVGLSFPIASKLSVETEVGYREGEGHINALSSHASLLYELPSMGRTRPYLAAGAGLEQYGAVLELPIRPRHPSPDHVDRQCRGRHQGAHGRHVGHARGRALVQIIGQKCFVRALACRAWHLVGSAQAVKSDDSSGTATSTA
jgi:hypothetical protein